MKNCLLNPEHCECVESSQCPLQYIWGKEHMDKVARLPPPLKEEAIHTFLRSIRLEHLHDMLDFQSVPTLLDRSEILSDGHTESKYILLLCKQARLEISHNASSCGEVSLHLEIKSSIPFCMLLLSGSAHFRGGF